MDKKISRMVSLLLALSLVCGAGALCQAGEEKSYIVGFRQPPGQTEKTLIQENGGKVKHEFKLVRALAATLSDTAKEKLKKHPKVAYVEEDAPVMAVEPELGGPEYDSAWGVTRIGAAEAHARGVTGAGVKVAVIDTGIDYTHPDLDDNYRGGTNFIALDPTYTDPWDDSYNSHGTHVAGIIAAENNGFGVVGVAPEADLYAVKVLDGSGFGLNSALIKGIEWAALNGMDIANISIGASTYSQAVDEACQLAAEAGVLLIAAAGNNRGGPVMYPARLDSVMAVTATMETDEPYAFAALGPEIELAAPGVLVNSTIRGGSYNILSGTSQASPHVAGTTALILSAGVADLNGDGSADARDVRLQLQGTAGDLGVPGRDEVFGFGLVSAVPAPPTLPADLLLVTSDKGAPDNGVQTVPLVDGLFKVDIHNDSLQGLDIDVSNCGALVDELSTSVSFKQKDDPAAVTLMIDATGSSLEAALVPKGKKGSFASVLVQKVVVQ